MVKKKVIVLTSTELGWDCVVDVFDADKVTMEELQKVFGNDRTMVLSEKTLSVNTSEYDPENYNDE